MKLDSGRVILWYSLSLGLSAAAVLFAYYGVLAALAGGVFWGGSSFFTLLAVSRVEEQSNPYLKLSEQIAMVGMVVFIPLIFIAGLLKALIVFIGFVLLALNFQTHNYRRFYLGMGVSFIGVAAGAAESRSGGYLVFFLAYAITVSMALGYAYIEQRGRGLALYWRGTDRARACLWLVGTAVLIYLLLPRFPAGNLGAQPGSDYYYFNEQWEAEAERQEGSRQEARARAEQLLREQAGKHGLGNEVEKALEPLRDKNPAQQQSSEIIRQGDFRYQGFQNSFDITSPDQQGDRFGNGIVARMRADRPLYLRARIFDRFDGLRWHTSAQQLSKLSMQFEGVELGTGELPPGAQVEAYEIIVERNLGDYIAAAAVPLRVKFPGSVIGIDGLGQLRSPGALKEGTRYAVESVRLVRQGRSFAETEYLDLPGFTQIPEGLDPRIGELAARVTVNAKTQLDAALALEQHLRSEYQYDLRSVFVSQNRTPLSEFLFESKKGHCEFFASALAMMLRTQGIPSRLVTGFSATNQNPLTGYYDIYALDGHAWVEAYVDGVGWVELEPTAYYDGPMLENETLSAEQINEYMERQQRLREALGQDGRFTFAGLVNGLWQAFYLIVTWLGAYLKLLLMHAWPWLLVLGMGTIVGWRVWLQVRPQWRAYCIRRRLRSGDIDQPRAALNRYLEAIDALLANAGYQRPPGWTIEQFLRELDCTSLLFDRPGLAGIFNKAQYAEGYGDIDPDEYRLLFDKLYNLGYRKLRASVKASVLI